ncbi:uncharacterized protein LOC110704074 [Chenopodium quinoa]|uniref:uncharacterized protein LOC110704074 n=1 Tax=Chenopodium quinoa TaxID=63459 RepID=UPI000B7924D3|nr:uncharacterized protein LOC110704074 [Chenopodium quinoa]
MEAVNYAWRIYKCRTKQKYFYAFATNEKRRAERPKTLLETYFEDLLNYWNLPKVQEESETNKRNREKLDDIHTMGPNSYAILRHKLEANPEINIKVPEHPNASNQRDATSDMSQANDHTGE